MTGQIIGAHPNAFLIDENDGLYDWFHATDNDLRETGDRLSKVIQKADTKYQNIHSRLSIDASGYISINENISHLVLKAPNLTYSFSRLVDLNVPVSILYPRRDPRSVVASMTRLANIDMVGNQCRLIRQNQLLAAKFSVELSQIEQNQVPAHIKRALIWRIKTEIVDQFLNSDIPTYNYDYEALVSNKKTYCSKFAKHAGLEHSPQMDQHELIYQGRAPGGTDRSRSIDTQSTKLWKKTLTDQQADDILQITDYKIGGAD